MTITYDDEPAPKIEYEERRKSRPMPANAGLANLGTSILGLPVDTAENAVNLTRAAQGGIAGLLGRTDFMPPLLQGTPGGSQWLKDKLRSTGMAGLSPDNPTPESKLGTAQYDFVSRGGIIPGGAVPAAGSMVAEKIGGPQWAGVGAMTPAAIGQTARALAPKPTPQTSLLAEEGVQMTPGQKYGGGIKRAEDAATSVPVLGDTIKAAQRRSVESFDVAAINRGLAPIGEKLPKGLVGHKAVAYAYTKLGDAYDNLLPNLRGEYNATLKSDLASISANAAETLPPAQRGQFNRIVRNEIINRFDQGGNISGESLKQIESKLGAMAKDFGRSENYDIRTMAQHVKDTQAALREMVTEVNPAYQGQLAKINDGYANFKIAQKAATSVAAPEGVFTPGQLHAAVKAKDVSKDKARFSEGAARMQDLSAAGKTVLPSSVQDSGTPYRAAAMYALTHPIRASLAAPAIGLATLPYTRIGQGVLSRISGGKPTPPELQALIQSILAERQQ